VVRYVYTPEKLTVMVAVGGVGAAVPLVVGDDAGVRVA
jgi:hypothetical protein